jgi:SAM-dependent methyltransferase
MIALATARAAAFGVSPALSECDQLLGYLINQAKMSPSAAVQAYIDGGHHDAAKVTRLMERLGLANSSAKVLEFAAGFGRVTRHLKTLSPKTNLVASDIHLEARDFTQNEIGVVAKPSDLDPQKLDIGTGYSLIFVLSLFSHLPHKSFAGFLKGLYEILAPGGYLMFTTHGQSAIDASPAHFGAFKYEQPGYAYRGDSDQPDIESSEYGTTLALPEYVVKMIATLPSAKIVSFASGEWFGIQDEWVIQKPKA